MQKADIFTALGDQSRREIIQLLRQRDMTHGELRAQFEFTKPTMTHHLKILKNTGLVTSEKKGKYKIYSLNTSVLEEITAMILDLFSKK